MRNRLNTRQLREGFVARGGRTKRPMKPPGTPLLTLSGEVILDRAKIFDSAPKPPRHAPPAPPSQPAKKEIKEKPVPPPASRAVPEERFPPKKRETTPEAEPVSLFTPVTELLKQEEVLDLLAYVLSGGDRGNAMFKN